MFDVINIVILVGSFLGMAVIALRKIPVLSELSPSEISSRKVGSGLIAKTKKKIKNNKILDSLSAELFLQRMLSKIKIIILKTDKKTDAWLMKLNQRSPKKKSRFSDDYWKKIKKRE